MKNEYFAEHGIGMELPNSTLHPYFWDIPPWYKTPLGVFLIAEIVFIGVLLFK